MEQAGAELAPGGEAWLRSTQNFGVFSGPRWTLRGRNLGQCMLRQWASCICPGLRRTGKSWKRRGGGAERGGAESLPRGGNGFSKG